MNKQTRVWLVLSIALSLLALGNACSKPANDTNATGGGAGTTAASEKWTGATGTISGVISFEGTPPAPKKIDTAADAVCGQKNPILMTDDTVVKDGKLANVFVYVKEGSVEGGKKFADYSWDTPTTPIKLDQNGCHYVPHVMGVMVNQKISITNSDATQHNIHWTPKSNPEWNQSQPNGAPPIEKTFGRSEILVPVKCNQHPWMRSYIGVLKHPLYSVSGENGSYEIKGVPPGKYTVVAWREGGAAEKTMEVTVAGGSSAKGDFSFGGGAATTSTTPSLQMMPAIEFPMLGKH
jgi:plastocyanin